MDSAVDSFYTIEIMLLFSDPNFKRHDLGQPNSELYC